MTVAMKLKEGSHQYTLTVTDDNGATNSTNLSVSVTKGDGGGGKKCNPRKQDCT